VSQYENLGSTYKRNNTVNVFENVTLNRVSLTVLHWKSNRYYIFWVCVCSLSCPTCKRMRRIVSISVSFLV